MPAEGAVNVMNRIVLFVLIALLAVSAGPVNAAEPNIVRHTCAINAGPCIATTPDGAYEVVFDITPKPVAAMRELSFRVRLTDKTALLTNAAVTIDLSMPGMYMGNNRVALAFHDGAYEGTGVIVRCPSGKKTWQADVVIRSSGKTAVTGFIFEVQ